MNLFSVIFRNLWGFDIIIFLAAILNGFVYYMVRKSSDKLYKKMNHKIHVSHFRLSRQQTDDQVSSLSIEEVVGMRDEADKFYSLFVNITGIFPLLGILGTVVSLLGLVSDMENVTGNFYGALTSTFWGLIFAIVFKFLDGMIAPLIENNSKSVQMYLERADENTNVSPAQQTVSHNGTVEGYDISDDDAVQDTVKNEKEPVIVDTYYIPEKRSESGQWFEEEPDKDLDFGDTAEVKQAGAEAVVSEPESGDDRK